MVQRIITFERDLGVAVVDGLTSSTIEAPKVACFDISNCGQPTHIKAITSGTVNYALPLCRGVAPLIQVVGKKKLEINPETTINNVALPAPRDINLSSEIREYIVEAIFNRQVPLRLPQDVAGWDAFTWTYIDGSWRTTFTNGLIFTVTNPRIKPVFDPCGLVVGFTGRSTVVVTYQDFNCLNHIYSIEAATITVGTNGAATNAVPFGSSATAVTAAGLLTAVLNGGIPAVPEVNPQAACATLPLEAINQWRTTVVPTLITPGITITDDIALAPGG